MNNQKLLQAKNNDFLRVFIASAFGFGLSPIAPGTCGALIGVAGHIMIVQLLPADIQMLVLALFFLSICVIHYILTPWAIDYWHSKDPKHFVLDEVAGYLVIPIFFRHGTLLQVVCWGFFFFRLFDIIKLPIARYIDRNMRGASAILFDDIVSAGYAVLMLYLLKYIGEQFAVERYLILI